MNERMVIAHHSPAPDESPNMTGTAAGAESFSEAKARTASAAAKMTDTTPITDAFDLALESSDRMSGPPLDRGSCISLLPLTDSG
jgi:hypothetical protein